MGHEKLSPKLSDLVFGGPQDKKLQQILYDSTVLSCWKVSLLQKVLYLDDHIIFKYRSDRSLPILFEDDGICHYKYITLVASLR